MTSHLALVLRCDVCGTKVEAHPADHAALTASDVIYHMTRMEEQLRKHMCLPSAPEHLTALESIG